ncbi:MAG: EAL domain-containing protein, partial [Rhodanobacter sp.]
TFEPWLVGVPVVGVASSASFGYFTVTLIAVAALAFGAGLQFLVIGVRERNDYTHVAFSALCGCIAVFAFGSALMNAATTLTSAILALRVVAGAAVLAVPAIAIFVGCYTARPMNRYALAILCLVCFWMFLVNLAAPYSVFDSVLHQGEPIVLPWGETLFVLNGTPSILGRIFRWSSSAVFVWALYRAGRQVMDGQRLRGAMLGLALSVQFLALLWGYIVVNTLNTHLPSIDSFAFPMFVLVMGLSLGDQMHRHWLQLRQTASTLQNEVEVRRKAELDLRHAAYHDALTGLPNRLRTLYSLADLLAEAAQRGQYGAVLMIDLDNFKTINDSLGHQVGDRVLEAIADSLLMVAPSTSTVGRLGGDEFVILLGTRDERAEDAAARAMQVAEKMLERLAAPLAIDNRVLGVGASIGVAVFPHENSDAADVLRCADIALFRAKSDGRNAARLFMPHMQRDADARLELERGLRTALEHEGFSLHFQPQVSLDGNVVGAEALLRWNHPILGAVPPATFIPIAEETGLINAIGSWVIDEACRHIHAWQQAGLDFGGRISVNVSAWQIANPLFAAAIEAQVKSAGVEPGALTLELTESALLRDFDAALCTLRALSNIGFRLSLDDFGTGYSSLAYLQQLPLEELKIDRSFISTLETTADPLAGFIIDVGHRLGMTTIAEGVETQAQMTVLRSLGCDLAQGYFVCVPLAADDFQRWLQQRAAERDTAASAITSNL